METYHGHVRTPADAIILFEACRIGLLPRVQRRLSEKERQSIKSGSVFVWDEREAGMRRWTDGKSWSASRVSGSFLTYREMEGKRGGGSVSRGGKTPESTRGSDDDREGGEEGPDGYRYKPDGLMKQSFSITTSTGQHLHLISYYARSHPTAPNLQQPSTDPALRHIRPQKGLYPESTVNDQQNLPVVTRGPMAGATFSLSPHPAIGYPRSGATHPQSYAPTYAWPPTPLATPPTITIPYTYLPPPLSAPPAQLAYAHHPPALPAPPPQHALPAPYDPHAHHPPESTLPPPLPPSTAVAPALPAFAGRSATVPQSSLDTQPRTTYGPGSIDPRLMSPRTQSLQAQRNGQPPRTIASPPQQKLVSTHLAPPTSAASSATTVPSIGALMNGASVPPLSTDASKAVDLPRNGNRSPNEASTTPDGPKDIPSEKIGFGGEDIRAIRQLDRVFTV
ncbi:hypothetical protein VTN02DRAFT_4399 [Thermoascus thermophilus]